ncbi:unnamed protein product [marine sediment metagenome]|uniref:Uncharacterized protein n=1 Tax=marine sediment metagenome TaxID=412755 RepID=X1CAK3_9ZZZZ
MIKVLTADQEEPKEKYYSYAELMGKDWIGILDYRSEKFFKAYNFEYIYSLFVVNLTKHPLDFFFYLSIIL